MPDNAPTVLLRSEDSGGQVAFVARGIAHTYANLSGPPRRW